MPHYSITFGKFIKREKQGKDYTSIQFVLTNDVPPRDSQDDKILPKHSKFNPRDSLLIHKMIENCSKVAMKII